MKLGILVTTDKYLDEIKGITKSAIAKGHSVSIFSMDDGTKLLGNADFKSLSQTKGVKMAFCDHSAKHVNAPTEGLPAEIAVGSQFDNANMNHEVDKVIVL